MNKPDDYMFVKEDRGAHFLFEVDQDAVVEKSGGGKAGPGGKAAPAEVAMAPETFIEVKRLAKISLDDVKVVVAMPPAEQKYYPLRKTQFYKENEKAPETTAVETAGSTPAPTVATPGPTETTTPAPGGDNGRAEAPLENPEMRPGGV